MAFDSSKMTCTNNGGGSDGVPYKEWRYQNTDDATTVMDDAGYFADFMVPDDGTDTSSGVVNDGDIIVLTGSNGTARGEFAGTATPSTSTVAPLDVDPSA